MVNQAVSEIKVARINLEVKRENWKIKAENKMLKKHSKIATFLKSDTDEVNNEQELGEERIELKKRCALGY